MLPNLKIGNLTAKYPIIQGGMGVGISLSSLAGAVARCRQSNTTRFFYNTVLNSLIIINLDFFIIKQII